MNDTKTIRNQIFEDRSIYADNYYETLERSAGTNSLNLEYGAASTAVRCATTLLIKAGYILIQTACIPTWNVYTLIYFNLVDFVSATFGFLCIGFFLSFGKKKTIFAKEPDYDEAVLGWCVAVFSSTIVTVLLAGRLTKTAFFIVTTVLNWLIAPLFFYFIYSEQGVMYKQTLMDVTVSVKDYGGCLLIHVIGSLIGLIGILFLGRRVMRLKEIYECSMGPDAPGLAVAGYFFIMIGMTFLNVPSRSYEQTHLPEDYTGLILINNLFAAVGSMTIVIIFGLYYQTYISYWFLLRIIQAGLAGMVMISAGQDVFTPLSTLGTSVLAGITFYWVAQFAYFSAFEDYCNIVAIHLIPGFIGMILPGLYASTDNMGFGTVEAVVAIAHLLWQIICLIIALVIVISAYSAIFFILRYCSCLRNSMEEIQYNRALRIKKHTSRRKFYQRIFPPKPTSIALLPGYDSKQIFKNQRLENPHEMNDRLMPNNVSMFAKSMTKNPLQNELEEPHKKKFVNFFDNPDPIEKSIEPEFLSLRTRFTTTKSSSEPLLDIQPLPTIIRRRCSTTGIFDKSLLKQRKFIQRPWNIHQKVRLYDLKKTEKRCNIALGNIEKCHTMEPITNDDHYSVEVINLNDGTVKIIKSPINIDDYYDSISESEI